jgi:hypothetical protein
MFSEEEVCTGYVVYPIRKGTLRSGWEREQRGANVELGREYFLDEGGCVQESEKGGIEVVESATVGKANCHLGLSKQVEKGDQKVGSAINV